MIMTSPPGPPFPATTVTGNSRERLEIHNIEVDQATAADICAATCTCRPGESACCRSGTAADASSHPGQRDSRRWPPQPSRLASGRRGPRQQIPTGWSTRTAPGTAPRRCGRTWCGSAPSVLGPFRRASPDNQLRTSTLWAKRSDQGWRELP
jgi:hypothetical protein